MIKNILFSFSLVAFAIISPFNISTSYGSDIFKSKSSSEKDSDIFNLFLNSCFSHSDNLEQWADTNIERRIPPTKSLYVDFPLNQDPEITWSKNLNQNTILLTKFSGTSCALISDHQASLNNIKKLLIVFGLKIEEETDFKIYVEELIKPNESMIMLIMENANNLVNSYIYVKLSAEAYKYSFKTKFYYFETDRFITIEEDPNNNILKELLTNSNGNQINLSDDEQKALINKIVQNHIKKLILSGATS